jgi:hypothetical protein
MEANYKKEIQMAKHNDHEIQCDCGETMKLQVYKTCAYYAGFQCINCGPYDRVSDYYNTKEEAEDFIKNNKETSSYWEHN